MRQTALYFLLIVFILILLIVPAVAMAASMPGMPMGEGTQTGAVKDTNSADYKPPQQAADDSTMAAIASAIFGIPVAAWFISRSVRKAKKTA